MLVVVLGASAVRGGPVVAGPLRLRSPSIAPAFLASERQDRHSGEDGLVLDPFGELLFSPAG
jgi:hypothetical protein